MTRFWSQPAPATSGRAPYEGRIIVCDEIPQKIASTQESYFFQNPYTGRWSVKTRVADTTDHEKAMSARFGRKKLVCFYCNKQSSIKYDRTIRQWECGLCDAMNFLDENGDITDPPVSSTFAEAPMPGDRRYAVRRDSIPQASNPFNPPPGNDIFCNTCLKNQHLFTSSLAQYEFDTDTSSLNYRKNEKEYFRFRKELEKRYPQVCEDCEPKVLEKLKYAAKTAKTDYLGRLLKKNRTKQVKHVTAVDYFQAIGKYMWYIGLAMQLLWHVGFLISALRHNYGPAIQKYVPQQAQVDISQYAHKTPSIAISLSNNPGLGLYVSLFGIWWNPKLRESVTGFMRHVSGFTEWYKTQAILFALRLVLYYIAHGNFITSKQPYDTVAIGLHVFGAITVSFLAIQSRLTTIKINMTPLWTSTPEKLPNVGPSTRSPTPNKSMMDLLNDIGSSRPQRPTTPPENPPHLEPAHLAHYAKLEAMDWSPTPVEPPPTRLAHRAFQPAPARSGQLFGSAPVSTDRGAFWYKVPPAPITPAHAVRNPPNQPRLRTPASTEDKANFFQRRDVPTVLPRKEKVEMEFAQQRLFAPEPQEKQDDLADLLGSFSLGGETPVPPPAREGLSFRALGAAAVLVAGGVFLAYCTEHVSVQF